MPIIFNKSILMEDQGIILQDTNRKGHPDCDFKFVTESGIRET